MTPQLSVAAKTKVASVAAVVMAAVTVYQEMTAGGHFRWWDVIPVVAAVLGVATTDHVENTLRSPAAKAVVHGALSLLAAITAALAGVIGSEPSGVSLAKLAVAGLSTLAVWYVPELAPDVRVIEGEVASKAPVAEVLGTVAADVSRWMGPDLPTPDPKPAPVPEPAAAPPATPEPTPIGDAAHAAALTTTQPLPAVAPVPAA